MYLHTTTRISSYLQTGENQQNCSLWPASAAQRLQASVVTPQPQALTPLSLSGPHASDSHGHADGEIHHQPVTDPDTQSNAATVGTMSLLLTPLVTDIQWPRSLKMGPAPKT